MTADALRPLTAADAGRTGFLPELEGLRGVAAWSIVLYHVWVFSSGAALTWNLGPLTVLVPPLQEGVTLFFVLSGFLLYRPFAAALVDGRSLPSTGRYLRNRALRILPAYWAILVLSGLVLRSAVVGAAGGRYVSGALDHPQTLVMDLLLVQNYSAHAINTGILPAWSLCIEAAFYLTLPLAAAAGALAARRLGGVRGVFVPPLLLLAVAFAARVAVSVYAASPHILEASWTAVAWRSFPANADLFAFGMAAAVVFDRWQRRTGPSWAVGAAAGRVLAYFGLPFLVLGRYFVPHAVYEPVVGLLAALLLLRLLAPRVCGASASPRPPLSGRWAGAAGRTSYGVFLWHYPILSALAAHGLLSASHTAAGFLFNLVLTAPLVAAAAACTYRLVERPALRLKRRATAPQRVPAAAGAAPSAAA